MDERCEYLLDVATAEVKTTLTEMQNNKAPKDDEILIEAL